MIWFQFTWDSSLITSILFLLNLVNIFRDSSSLIVSSRKVYNLVVEIMHLTHLSLHMHVYVCTHTSLELWGYKRVEEIIWVKTNQLQRIIRTGRTGHWLNHSKEHCLVGLKGHPLVNRNIDTDVIVAEVRETSRKPDEVTKECTSDFLLKLMSVMFSNLSCLAMQDTVYHLQ